MTPVMSLCWKEYREQRLFWLAVLALGYGLVFAVGWTLAPAGVDSIASDPALRQGLLGLALVLASGYAVACAGLLFAGERENGTEPWLDRLVYRRTDIWFIKVAVGLFLTLALGAALAALGGRLRVTRDEQLLGQWWGFILLLALDCYAWGLVGSVQARTVLGGAAITAGVLLVLWPILLVLGSVAGEGMLVVRVLSALAAMGLSWWLYTSPDRARVRGARTAAAGAAPITTTRVLLWLGWRQGQFAMVGVLVFAVLMGVLIALRQLWLLWPVASLILGLACGVLAFADEQVQRTHRFLGEQRVPPGPLWLGKVLLWSVVLFVGWLVLALIGPGGLMAQQRMREGVQSLAQAYDLMLGGHGSLVVDPVLFLLLCPVHGFAVGLIVGQVFRKPVVAGLVGLLLGGFLAAIWLPSVFIGGLPAWTAFILPLLLLLASRLMIRPWLGDRLQTRRPLWLLAGLLALGLCWNAGVLWWRVEAIPDVGPPFEVKAFKITLDPASRSGTGEKLRTVADLLRDQEKAVTKKVDPPRRSADGAPGEGGEGPNTPPPVTRSASFGELLHEAAAKGWSKEVAGLTPWLDALFAESWAKELEETVAGPTGLILDPRGATVETPMPWLELLRTAAYYSVARAEQWQAKGELEPAWRHLLTCLELSRQLRQPMGAHLAFAGYQAQDLALDGLGRWQRHPKITAALLRRALDRLNRLEEELPSLADVCKAQYLIFENSRNQMWPGGQRYRYAKMGVNAPWEKEREQRLIHLVWAQVIGRAETGMWVPLAPQDPSSQTAERLGFGKNDAPLSYTQENWGRLLALTAESSAWPNHVPSLWWLHAHAWRSQQALRIARLRMADALFRVEQGRGPANPGELVPRYLAAVPIDPQTGQRFTMIPPFPEPEKE